MSFSPLKILQNPYSVILLNHNGFFENEKAVINIWNNATSRISVDGGTNLWHDLYQSSNGTLKEPNFVSGDFDSILPDVLTYVKTRTNHITVIPTPDQDHTDFWKGLQIILNDKQSPKTVIALMPNRAGRFDHQMSNLNTLIRSAVKANDDGGTTRGTICDLLLYDHHNVIFAVPSSLNNSMQKIELKPNMTCGIIPICGDTNIKSRGLKWDLDDIYAFGKVVSTSNETTQTVIEIQTDHPIIFSAACSLSFN